MGGAFCITDKRGQGTDKIGIKIPDKRGESTQGTDKSLQESAKNHLKTSHCIMPAGSGFQDATLDCVMPGRRCYQDAILN